MALGNKIVPTFDQDGIDKLPAEDYSAALLDAAIHGWAQESTKVAVLQDWLKARKGEGSGRVRRTSARS